MKVILIERVNDAVPITASLEDQVLTAPHLIKLEGDLGEISQIVRQGSNLVIV